MNILLWIVQAILAVKLLSVSFTHAFNQSLPTMQEAMKKLGRHSRSLLFWVAFLTFLAALGLILPGVLGVSPMLTPITAIGLAVLLLVSLFFHVRSREKPKIFVSMVLFTLAVFIAWGRWTLLP